MDGYNPRGVELLCEVVREQVEVLPCPGCSQPLAGVRIDLRHMALDQVIVDLVCRTCQARWQATVSPASEGGIAIIR